MISRLVFKWDALGKEILGMALPAALAVAADPIASLIDTAFIGHIGMVFVFYLSISDLVVNELAFLGVQTILFCVQDRWSSLQQVSRSPCSIKLRGLPFFHWSAFQPPLLREEDTVANMKLKATQVENLEDESLDNLEKGAAKKEIEDLDKNSSAKTCEMQGLTGDDKLENAKAGAATSTGESLARKSESNSEEEKDASKNSNSKDSEAKNSGSLSFTSLSSSPSY